MLKGRVPWPALVPAPGASKVMIVDSRAVAERHSPSIRVRTSDLFRRTDEQNREAVMWLMIRNLPLALSLLAVRSRVLNHLSNCVVNYTVPSCLQPQQCPSRQLPSSANLESPSQPNGRS